MNIRPFQLPQDIDIMNSLVMDGFQYPENPEWSVQDDERQGMIDNLNTAKRLWPLIKLMRVISPVFRDILCGFIAEENNKPVGLINYMRQRNEPEWFIANVTILPSHRRRGLARKLVETTLSELRKREARVVFLDVIVGNDPAFKLYQTMGFEAFTQSSQYDYQKDDPVTQPAIPTGYTISQLGDFDWQTRFNLDKRITPEHVTRYAPITEGRYRIPWIMPIFGKLFESLGGSRGTRFAIQASNGDVAGFGQYSYRTRAGGVNFVKASVDPAHPQLADFILGYMLAAIQKASPGHRIELNLEDWQSSLIASAQGLGCERRLGYHRMGLRFQG
jgi:ribosomal protein S18 acetylase RimI-like enzyme